MQRRLQIDADADHSGDARKKVIHALKNCDAMTESENIPEILRRFLAFHLSSFNEVDAKHQKFCKLREEFRDQMDPTMSLFSQCLCKNLWMN